MKVSINGLKLIKEFEGFESEPYLDVAGICTIGIGFTYYMDGTKVTMDDDPMSEEQALELLECLVEDFGNHILKKVTKELNQNQFDALVSFTYNVGKWAFSSSTLLKRINNNPCDEDIKNQFSRWNKVNRKVVSGLTRRRKAEATLYFT